MRRQMLYIAVLTFAMAIAGCAPVQPKDTRSEWAKARDDAIAEREAQEAEDNLKRKEAERIADERIKQEKLAASQYKAMMQDKEDLFWAALEDRGFKSSSYEEIFRDVHGFVKGEFETSEEWRIRTESIVNAPYLVRPMVAKIDYDSDKREISIYLNSTSSILFPFGEFVIGEQKTLKSSEFIGQNAFGAKSKAKSITTVYKGYFINFTKPSPLLRIDVEPDVARRIKSSGKILLAVSPAKHTTKFADTNDDYHAATIHVPLEQIDHYKGVMLDFRGLVVIGPDNKVIFVKRFPR